MRIMLTLLLSFTFSCAVLAEDGVPPGGEPSPGGEPAPDDAQPEPQPESKPPRKNRPRDRGRMRRRMPNWERMAERFDKNGDGKIERDELQGPAQRMFDRLDVDGDGAITKKDVDAVKARQGGAGRQAGRGSARQSGMLSAQRLDTNRDKKISAAEWKAFYEGADQNGDGVLDRDEWLAAATGKALRDGAPSVGAKAPNVSAKRLGSEQVVDLGRPTRYTVLVFGSYT